MTKVFGALKMVVIVALCFSTVLGFAPDTNRKISNQVQKRNVRLPSGHVPKSTSYGCNWIESNANTVGEMLVGFVYSYDECIELVVSNCPDADIANVDEEAGSSIGSCWCQWGSDQTTDNMGWMSCQLIGIDVNSVSTLQPVSTYTPSLYSTYDPAQTCDAFGLCPFNWIGDGICDTSCYNADCSWDDHDCGGQDDDDDCHCMAESTQYEWWCENPDAPWYDDPDFCDDIDGCHYNDSVECTDDIMIVIVVGGIGLVAVISLISCLVCYCTKSCCFYRPPPAPPAPQVVAQPQYAMHPQGMMVQPVPYNPQYQAQQYGQHSAIQMQPVQGSHQVVPPPSYAKVQHHNQQTRVVL